MSNTIYLVTGAAGFLGSTICRQLVERGDKVRGLVLPTDKSAKYLPDEVEVCRGDVCDMSTLQEFFTVPEGYETIVLHIASIVTVTPDYNPVVMNVNVGGTKNIINGEMPMGIDGSFNLCDVRDLAAGTIAAADKGKIGHCYILANEEVSFKDFSKLLVEESGCKPIKAFLPIKVANFIAKIAEKQAEKKDTEAMMTTFSVYNLARNSTFDYSKAQNELGYTTRPYEETIRDMVKWLKKEGKIK